MLNKYTFHNFLNNLYEIIYIFPDSIHLSNEPRGVKSNYLSPREKRINAFQTSIGYGFENIIKFYRAH